MANKSLYNSWAMLTKHFNKTLSKNISLGQVTQNTKLNKDLLATPKNFDWALYCSLHDDLRDHGISDEKKAVLHYAKHGKREGRVSSISDLFNRYELAKISIPRDFRLEQFAELNQLELMAAGKKLEKFLNSEKSEFIKISPIDDENSKFFLEMAIVYDHSDKKEKAYQCYIYSNYFKPNSNALEHMGNWHLNKGDYEAAAILYVKALQINKNRKCTYKNIIDCYFFLKNYEKAISIAIEGLKCFPDLKFLHNSVDQIIEKYWQESEQRLIALSLCSERSALIAETDRNVDYIATVYHERSLLLSDPIRTQINKKRVLMIGDFGLPQCRRYRVYQKLEQLAAAGFEANAMPWTEAQKHLADPEQCHQSGNKGDDSPYLDKRRELTLKTYQDLAFEEAITLNDIIIFYRVPAYPHIVNLIEQAKALGKVTFYEIDDLLFEPNYPPPLESYGGFVNQDFYFSGLVKGMAYYRSAARLCQFGIASTQPLAEKLGRFVESGKCFLHRNGLDCNTPSKAPEIRKNKAYIDIIYGSGTHAHNIDFIVEVLPALDKLLVKHAHVRLIIAGYLQLPSEFLKKHEKQLILKPFVELSTYLSYLSEADINIAVLLEDDINDCKSELKWFEAASLGIPSVVSRTRNYLDVIRDKEDGFIVSGVDQWFATLDQLIVDPNKRFQVAEAAMKRVQEEYSVSALADNIRNVIETAIDNFYEAQKIATDTNYNADVPKNNEEAAAQHKTQL